MTNGIDLNQLGAGYAQDGYAVLPSLFDADQVAAIANDVASLTAR